MASIFWSTFFSYPYNGSFVGLTPLRGESLQESGPIAQYCDSFNAELAATLSLEPSNSQKMLVTH